MGLRVKLASTFLILLVLATLAISIASLDRTLRVMARSLNASGDRVTKEIFEQMRGALAAGGRDPVAALRRSRALRTAIDSAQAFGKYVVYVRVASSDGRIIAAAEPAAAGSQERPPSIAQLQQRTLSAVPLALLPALWGDHVYEVSAPVVLNGKPFGSIEVGLSTALMAADVHRLVAIMFVIALTVIVLASLAVAFLGNRMLKPVRAIASGVEQLTAGDGTEVNLEIPAHDELGALADKFNQLSRRVRFERARWERERGRLVDVFRSTTDAVLLIDADGSLLFANEEARRTLSLDNATAKSDGKPLKMLLGPDHPLMQLVGPALAVGNDVRDVAIELSPGKTSDRFLASILSLGQGPSPAGLLVMLRDLARMHELESVVDYSSRLARLGGLLSGVAHQVRGPLNAMAMQVELLRQEAADGKPVEGRVDHVRQEIRRLDSAIDALMRFIRPQQLKPEKIGLNELLLQIGGRVSQPGVSVAYQLEDGLPAIRCDGALLTEALQNIVQNGVEAMAGGGVLTLRSWSAADGLVEVDIADQGCGIQPTDLKGIFDLYFTTKRSGSGLGLPLALRAIDLIGGAMSVDSQVGIGTTFKIRLPTGKDAKALSAPVRET